MADPARPESAERLRLDRLLVSRGLAENSTKARALIMAGRVWQGDRRLDKPGLRLSADAPLNVRGRTHPWVSRGGVKLAHALAHFAVPAASRVALDIGSSTGGFTDVLLAEGASRVYAVDVGRGQLAWTLRNDPRVIIREGLNARYIGRAEIPQAIGLVVCDVSFISLTKVLSAALALTHGGAHLIALVKPQFEVGKCQVGKGGIVRRPEVHREVCDRLRKWVNGVPDWRVLGITESPITGSHGNKEFFIAAHRSD